MAARSAVPMVELLGIDSVGPRVVLMVDEKADSKAVKKVVSKAASKVESTV